MTHGAPRSAFQDQPPMGRGRSIPPSGGVRPVMGQGGYQYGRGFGHPGTRPAMDTDRRQGEHTARGTEEGPPQEVPSRPISDRPHPDPFNQENQGFRGDVAEPVDPNSAWAGHLRTHLDQHAAHPHQWAERDGYGAAPEHQPGVPDAYGMNPPRTQQGVPLPAPTNGGSLSPTTHAQHGGGRDTSQGWEAVRGGRGWGGI